MPFGRDLAPGMLHRHAGHGEAVARITWCVDQRAIGVITGEVGAGKTVAVRAATANLDPSRHVFIYLANPTIGVRGMLTHIVATLGHTPAYHKSALAPQAAEALASEHAERGRNPVLVIDEAHLLDNHQLEAIRLLTNHDMDSGSPFAVILVGQPSLRHRLRLGVLAALDQRIAVRYTIAGMSGADTADYIRHHLQDCRPSRHAVLRGRDRVDPQRLPWPSPRSQQPRPARTDRRIRRRSRHRRRKGRPHRDQRNRRGLNPIRVNTTSTTSTRRASRHHAHHRPAHHTERGRSHHRLVVNPNDAIIVIQSDAQHRVRS